MSTRAARPSDAPSSAMLGARLAGGDPSRGVARHIERLPARPAVVSQWPSWLSPTLLAALTGGGVAQPWSHQREAMDRAWSGEHVIVSTGTASGKSLAYLAPSMTAVLDGLGSASGRAATVLYLAPTKALAEDQRARMEALALPGVRIATYDGDTPSEERRWIRQNANVVLTNPDLLHHSLLPGHDRWRPFLRALRYVVIDECHTYRGVFGSQVAGVLRRLWRLAGRYGAQPTAILASATIADPALHAQRLLGLPCTGVVEDGSPRAAMTVVMWEPPNVEGGRRAATTEAAGLLADLVDADVQTVAFARSRAGVEALATRAQSLLTHQAPRKVPRIAAYRGGYLPEDRRLLERGLRERHLLGVAATNALELGVDISGLDAVITAGWPGRRASFWQQAGRAGRAGRESLAIFVAADDPLDTYLLGHPEALFGEPLEATVLDPDNPHVLGPQLVAAAAEFPLTTDDLDIFGPNASSAVRGLTDSGLLRRRPTGWYWPHDRRPPGFSLRGSVSTVAIVDRRSGRILGTIDHAAAHAAVHTGAVYVHQGETYVVTDLDIEAGIASVVHGDPGWSTYSQSVSTFDLVHADHGEVSAGAGTYAGRVRVTSQVTGFLRRLPGGEVVGRHHLDLPPQTLDTRGVWWTLDTDLLTSIGLEEARWPGSLHAAEHAAIGLLPLVASSDRWDVGGVSTVTHPDTGKPTILVYDGYPGGAGFADRAAARLDTWLTATMDAVESCPCATGCPSCTQSPKCGNGNEPLDKQGAIAVLRAVLSQRARQGRDHQARPLASPPGGLPASSPGGPVSSGGGRTGRPPGRSRAASVDPEEASRPG